MIGLKTSTQSSNGHTLITIRNYGLYQDSVSQQVEKSRNDSRNESTTDQQRLSTNNNEKNDNKGRKEEIRPGQPTAEPPSFLDLADTNSLPVNGANHRSPGASLVAMNGPSHPSTRRKKRSAEPDAESLAHFETFYELFPRHVAREDALNAWLKLSPDAETRARIVSGVKRYAASVQGTEAKFIKHPGSWLRGKRWEDKFDTNGPRYPSHQTSPNAVRVEEKEKKYAHVGFTRE